MIVGNADNIALFQYMKLEDPICTMSRCPSRSSPNNNLRCSCRNSHPQNARAICFYQCAEAILGHKAVNVLFGCQPYLLEQYLFARLNGRDRRRDEREQLAEARERRDVDDIPRSSGRTQCEGVIDGSRNRRPG
jgi:hypothetical protein